MPIKFLIKKILVAKCTKVQRFEQKTSFGKWTDLCLIQLNFESIFRFNKEKGSIYYKKESNMKNFFSAKSNGNFNLER